MWERTDTWVNHCFQCMRPLKDQGIHRRLHAKMHRSNLAVLRMHSLVQLQIDQAPYPTELLLPRQDTQRQSRLYRGHTS